MRSEMSDKANPEFEPKRKKKVYHSPSLTSYGDIRSLTAGGAGTLQEPGVGQGQPKDKHP